jgi:hypothetical protein
MLHYAPTTQTAPAAPPALAAPGLETDPVKIIGRTMKELAAQGRTVDKAALLGATEMTGEEIDRYGEAAADHARKLLRGEV